MAFLRRGHVPFDIQGAPVILFEIMELLKMIKMVPFRAMRDQTTTTTKDNIN